MFLFHLHLDCADFLEALDLKLHLSASNQFSLSNAHTGAMG